MIARLSQVLAAGVHELLAPRRCLACRRRGGDGLWCPGCADAVRRLGAGCRRCAAAPGTGHACWAPDAPVTSTAAVFDYRGPLAAAIRTAKLEGVASAWPPLARELAAAVRAVDVPDTADVVTWVTTPPARARRRGLDHAQVLAGHLAAELALPSRRLLTASASRRGDRYEPRHRLPASSVVLVDDVVTTGLTARRAAASLRRAGAGEVHLAVIARAGSHPLGVVGGRRGVRPR